METIKEILMRRDGNSESEAEERIEEAEEALQELLDDGGDLFDAEDIIRDCFGLEPDYLWEIMPI